MKILLDLRALVDKFFREEYSVYGRIFKPTGVGKDKDSITLTSRYDSIW